MTNKRLGIGFIGSGFITRFHIKSLIGVRDADARGVWSPNKQRAEEAATLARELRVGDCRAFDSIEEMVASPDVDAIWLCGPNHRRVENMEAIVRALKSGKGKLTGIAVEKLLARQCCRGQTSIELIEESGLLHAPSRRPIVRAGHLARARDTVAAGGGADRAALSGAMRRGAQWPGHALVLAR